MKTKDLFKATAVNVPAEEAALHPSHVERVTTALGHVGRGTDILRELLLARTSPMQTPEGSSSSEAAARLASERSGVDQSASPPPSQELQQRSLINVDGEVMAKAFMPTAAERAEIIAACSEVFEQLVSARREMLKSWPPDSAAHARLPDLLEALTTGAKQLIEERLAEQVSKAWKS